MIDFTPQVTEKDYNKILVTGGRDYERPLSIHYVLSKLNFNILIHGAATGADSWSGKIAKAMGKDVIPIKADWDSDPKNAGTLRNIQMLNEHPDIELVIAYPGNFGTKNMISLARNRKIPIFFPIGQIYQKCIKCQQRAWFYSYNGKKEVSISGFCEFCFDELMTKEMIDEVIYGEIDPPDDSKKDVL